MTTLFDTKPSTRRGHATLALIYGALCYTIFLGVLVYTPGFVGDLYVPKSLDSGPTASPLHAILVDVALLSLFALQHSIMARATFKRWWMRFISPPIERSTYVLFASLALVLLYWQWLPIRGDIWNVEQTPWRWALLGLYVVGWLIVLISSFLINHFDLFGLRQVYLHWQARQYTTTDFKTPALYTLVRHPMMVGFLLAFWATPHMTTGHLLFAIAMTAYILLGIHLEERDLLASFGKVYQIYQQRVRMLLPLPK
ncbi:MAG: putative conserved integral membrane protein [Ktedonobacterales bacterium]|jgi:protein-S-isoprenylcysteine O-methyltransferase Ste14|nr:MAG: putative conserved integral membrane protein [Ktedonobacterales bacterium]